MVQIEGIDKIISEHAPIVTLLIGLLIATISYFIKKSLNRVERHIDEAAEWRERVEKRLNDLEGMKCHYDEFIDEFREQVNKIEANTTQSTYNTGRTTAILEQLQNEIITLRKRSHDTNNTVQANLGRIIALERK